MVGQGANSAEHSSNIHAWAEAYRGEAADAHLHRTGMSLPRRQVGARGGNAARRRAVGGADDARAA